MKHGLAMVTAVVVGSLAFNAWAAKEISREKVAAMNLTKIGDISVSDPTAPMSAKRELSKKADDMGGKYFAITGKEQNDRDVYVSADVYK